MPKLMLLTAATAALISALAMVAPRAEATVPTPAASLRMAAGEASVVEQARMSCTHRRVCRQGAGCAWRKVCKRW